MNHANVLFLSHTEETRKVFKAGMGEIANALKFKRLIEKTYPATVEIRDVFSLFKEEYEPLALLNQHLAESGEEVLTNCLIAKPFADALPKSDYLFLLSWSWSLAALYTTGFHKNQPTISKLYVHHQDEIIHPKLYEPCNLLVTESLLASERAIKYGIAPEKIIYLPHHTPQEQPRPDRKLIEKKAHEKNKRLTKDTVILGISSRLEYGKNVEYALEAARRLYLEGEDILVYLKGNFVTETPYAPYHAFLKEKMEELEEEPWLLWDPDPTPFLEVLTLYAAFDICIHLSGAEAGSNAIVEFLSLGKPTLVLNCTTNPSLFQGGALFIEKDPTLRPAATPFYTPKLEDLVPKLKALVQSKVLRKEWGEKARRIAEERFHPDRTTERLPLIFEAAANDYKGKNSSKQAILTLYQQDKALYGL